VKVACLLVSFVSCGSYEKERRDNLNVSYHSLSNDHVEIVSSHFNLEQ